MFGTRTLPLSSLILCFLGGAALADTKPSLPRPPGPPRSVSSPHEAWIGHWRSDDGKTDYYVNPHELVMVDEGKPQAQLWAVMDEDDDKRTMDCAIIVQHGEKDPNRGHIKRMTFTTDYRKVDYTITIRGVTIDSHILYVDDLQRPPR